MCLDTANDANLKNISTLNWLPWVGCRYNKLGLLLIGDSHYDDEDGSLLNCKDLTRDLINNQGLNSSNPEFGKVKFLRIIEKTILNKRETTLTDREYLWTSVGFLNLCQRLLPSRNERPTEADFDKGWKSFFEIISILKPTMCIKFGVDGVGRLGYFLNNNDTGWERNVKEFYEKPYIINLTKQDHKLKIAFVNHPTGSYAFDYEYWATLLYKEFPSLYKYFHDNGKRSS